MVVLSDEIKKFYMKLSVPSFCYHEKGQLWYRDKKVAVLRNMFARRFNIIEDGWGAVIFAKATLAELMKTSDKEPLILLSIHYDTVFREEKVLATEGVMDLNPDDYEDDFYGFGNWSPPSISAATIRNWTSLTKNTQDHIDKDEIWVKRDDKWG